jgi:molecular chaperone GrpE
MSDALAPDDEIPPVEEVAVMPAAAAAPDVAFVVPAAAYDSIDTDDELAARASPRARAEAPAADSTRVVEAIRALEGALGKRLDALQTLFDREIRAEATREKVVDRLHAELQEYKQDLLLNTLRPVFVDLIQLHDDIDKLIHAQDNAEGEVARLLGLMRGFQQAIEDILYRQGVEPFTGDGPTFDPRRQRAVATVPTDDPALAKAVAARHRKGFRAGEKVIRPEIVSVYALKH